MTSAPKRGRPATGAALSGAERTRRYRERMKARITVTGATGDDNPPFTVTDSARNDKSTQHRTLFAIPRPMTSDSTALIVRTLPEAQAVTGDRELDGVLWLRQICKTTTDLAALDQAVEAAGRIASTPKELENRYSAWLSRQPGAHPFGTAMASMGFADITSQAERARERIARHMEGMAAFGSFDAAMEPTPAERHLEVTAALPSDWNGYSSLGMERLAVVFARSVNPASLTEVANELGYWEWLSRVRWRMSETECPGSYSGDDRPVVSARREYLEKLLLVLAPIDQQEARWLADRLKDGLVDIGTVDDGQRRAEILDHLVRTMPMQ